MAGCSKTHAIKAALIACFLLLLLNLMNSRLDGKVKETFTFSHSSIQWPHRTRSNDVLPTFSKQPTSNVYTLLWNSDNTTIKNITFNSISVTSHANNSHLLIDSADFKRKFPNHENLNKSSSDKLANNGESDNDAKGLLHMVMTTLRLKSCPLVPPNLDGPVTINTTLESMEDIEKRFEKILLPGGWNRPECVPHDKVAVIVPFRDRYAHLPIFLKNLHPFLIKQQVEYGIFIVEQANGKPFNRAALMNIGFLEASKLYNWDCFIFHDVDLLPLDDRNLYTCPDQPRHMSVAINVFGFKLPYNSIFGGVSAMTTSQFKKVNGFSNSFWGWGGEDDDMSNRLKHANFHISRYPVNIARYMMLNHQKEKANPKRYENLANGAKKFDIDGINSVKYEVYSSKKFPLFTWFLVELKMPEHR